MTLAAPKQEMSTTRSRLSAVARRKSEAEEPSHLAHDARNWLTVLQMYCDLLRTSGVVTEEGEKWIKELSSAVERGYGLVDSLLESAQPPVSLQRLSPKKVSSSARFELAAAIERRLPLLRQMAGSQIQVDIKTVAQAGPIALREPEFERIFLNLTRNAIEAMPHGGRLKIALEYGHPSHRPARLPQRPTMVLRVSDTGEGIPAELLPHIFDSGVSTKLVEDEATQSRGFGLAIARELTLGAGGSIRVRSRPGHGTSFEIELPLLELPLLSAPCSPASQPKKRKPGALSEMPKPTEQKTICDANRKGIRVPC